MTEWKRVADFDAYEISNHGQVRRVDNGKIIRPWVHRRAPYLCVTLHQNRRRKSYLTHRLVALTFIGTPPTERHQVAHIDGSKQNNSVSNLRWATPEENQADRKTHGTSNTGSRHPRSKLTEIDVIEMRALRSKGHTSKEIAQRYGIGQAYASSIVCGRFWKHVPGAVLPDQGSARRGKKFVQAPPVK